jgi:hypothetical protein
VFVLGVGLCCAAPAFAQSAAVKKEAAGHYQRGVDLYKEANYAAALAEFKAANEQVPNAEVLFNIALTERRLFKYGQAIRTFNRYLLEGGHKVTPARQTAVAQELEQIRALVAPIAVIVNGGVARLLIDGEFYANAPLNEMIPLGPGTHVVRAEREGDAPDEKTIEVVSGVGQALTLSPRSLTAPVAITVETVPAGASITFDGDHAAVTPATVGVPPGTHELVAKLEGYSPSRTEVQVAPGQPRTVKLTLFQLESAVAQARPRKFPTVGVAIAGGGVLLAGAGVFFTFEAQRQAARVTALAKQGGTWDASWAKVESTGKLDQTLGVVGIAAGSAVFVGGLVTAAISLLATPDAAPHVALSVTPGGAAVSLSGSF